MNKIGAECYPWRNWVEDINEIRLKNALLNNLNFFRFSTKVSFLSFTLFIGHNYKISSFCRLFLQHERK